MQGNTATTYLVDTNVLSNRRDVEADPNVIEWLRRHGGQIRISVVTVAEIRRGLLLLEARLTRTADSRVRRGARKVGPEARVYNELTRRFSDRIEPIGLPVAEYWAEISVVTG